MKNNINNYILFLVLCLPLLLKAMDYDLENQRRISPHTETVCYRRQLTVTPKIPLDNPDVVIEIFEEVKYKKKHPKAKGFGCSDVLRASCFTCVITALSFWMDGYNE